LLIDDPGGQPGAAHSRWVLVTDNTAFLELPELVYQAARQPDIPPGKIWTDDYSNLLPSVQGNAGRP
jgi:hypothetical protein